MVDVFISYRRQDSQKICEDLYQHLTKNLPDLEIFMDVEGIEPGKKWKDILESGSKKCNVLIAIIGPDWISIKNEKGVRRITERTDYVRKEISNAIRNYNSIIPVLVNGARIPDNVELPHSIKDITRYQAFSLSDDIEEDSKVLAERINKAIKEKKADDRGRVLSKIIDPMGIVLVFPFYIIYETLSKLVKGVSSNFRTIMLFLLMMIICSACLWLTYQLLS